MCSPRGRLAPSALRYPRRSLRSPPAPAARARRPRAPPGRRAPAAPHSRGTCPCGGWPAPRGRRTASGGWRPLPFGLLRSCGPQDLRLVGAELLHALFGEVQQRLELLAAERHVLGGPLHLDDEIGRAHV